MFDEPLTLSPGHHVCCVVSSDRERTLQAASWAAEGLAAGERVVHIERDLTAGPVPWLDQYGVDWRDAASTGQLSLLHPKDAYSRVRAFDLDRCTGEFESLIDHALADGYSGVRVSEDAATTIEVRKDPGWLREYEARLEDLCEGQPVSELCFYDRRTFDSDLLEWADLHASLSEQRLHAMAQPGRVCLTGEVDVSNVQLLTPTLRKATAQGGELVVDLQALAFIDLESSKHLVDLANRLAPSSRVKLLDPPGTLCDILDESDWADEFDVVDTNSALASTGLSQ